MSLLFLPDVKCLITHFLFHYGVTPTALHRGNLTRPRAFSPRLDTWKIPLTRPVLTIHSPLTAVLELSV